MTSQRHSGFVERAIARVGGAEDERDELIVEAPLEISVAGEPVVVLMRTPGHDEELALGLTLTEGWASDAAVVAFEELQCKADVHGDRIGLSGDGVMPPKQRTLASTSSCGLCGKTTLSDVLISASPIRSAVQLDAEVIASLPERMRAEQELFSHTGGVHAAGLFTVDGQALCVREDVGRHNAVDKVIGWAARSLRWPVGDVILCVSGRVSYEIMTKAVAARIPAVVAVSAPSSLAVDMAERYCVTLCGFVREGRFNSYAHRQRIVGTIDCAPLEPPER